MPFWVFKGQDLSRVVLHTERKTRTGVVGTTDRKFRSYRSQFVFLKFLQFHLNGTKSNILYIVSGSTVENLTYAERLRRLHFLACLTNNSTRNLNFFFNKNIYFLWFYALIFMRISPKSMLSHFPSRYFGSLTCKCCCCYFFMVTFAWHVWWLTVDSWTFDISQASTEPNRCLRTHKQMRRHPNTLSHYTHTYFEIRTIATKYELSFLIITRNSSTAAQQTQNSVT